MRLLLTYSYKYGRMLADNEEWIGNDINRPHQRKDRQTYEKDNDDNDSEDGAERLCGVYDVPRRAEGEGGYWMVL